MMGFFDGFLWAMVCLGSVGILVDFLLGKPGQKRLRGLLETWWFQLSDVHWRNFGHIEASLFVRVLDRAVGPRLFSWRRLIASVAIILLAKALDVTIGLISGEGFARLPPEYGFRAFEGWRYATAVLALMLSLSITRVISATVRRLPTRPLLSIPAFALLVGAHVLLYLYWTPSITFTRTRAYALIDIYLDKRPVPCSEMPPILRQSPGDDCTELYYRMWSAQVWNEFRQALTFRTPPTRMIIDGGPATLPLAPGRVDELLDILVNVVRISFAAIFLLSVALGAALRDAVMVLLARIVESEKPIATMVLGGMATAAKLLQEAVKRFA